MHDNDPAEELAAAAPQAQVSQADPSKAEGPAEEPAPRLDEPDELGGDPSAEGEPAAAGPPEAPAPPAAALREKPDERRLYLIAAGAAAFLLLLTLVLFWQSRREVGALRDELAVVRLQARRSEVLQQQATLLRVRADLQGLRQTLPPDLAVEVDKADGALAGLSDRLRASR